MPSRARVQDFIATVEANRFVEAIEEFYTEDASMQENGAEPRRGREVLVAGEKAVLAAFESVRTMPVGAWLIDGDRVAIHWTFEFTAHDGAKSRIDEIAWQLWRGDRIAEERFFYDPGKRAG